MALYTAIKDTPGIMRVRRAEMRQGEVPAEPIDFIIDVDLKTKRVLHYIGPVTEELGKEFDRCRLGVDGDYKMLYFKMKNRQVISKEEPSGVFE